MSIELASAYVSLVPSASGIAAGIASEMGGPLQAAAEEAGEKTSKSFGDKFTSGLAAVGKVAAAGLALAVAGVAGLESIGSSFDDAFDSIRVQTGKTGIALDGLEGSFRNVVKNVPVDFGEASAAIGGLSQKLGLTGQPLEDLSTQVLNLSRLTKTDLATNVAAAAGVLNSWGVAAENQGPKLDELFRISQATGISVSDLATQMTDGGAQFRAAGLSFEESGALLGTLAKNGLSASDVLPALSKAMAVAAKEGKPANDVFKDTFAAIANAPNDVAAGSIAFDVFGAKAGPKFASLIREGKLSYEDFAASIAAGGDTINDAATDTDDWHEKLKLLANKALLYLEPIATKVFDAITKAITWATPYVQTIAAWLGDHLPGAIAVVRGFIVDKLVPAFKVVADWIVDHWPQISAVVSTVFDKIRDVIAYFVDVIVPKVVSAFKTAFGWLMDNKEVLIGVAAAIAVGLVAMFVSWAASAATAAAATLAAAAPVVAIGAAIAGLVAGVLYAYNHFKTFRTAVDAVGRAIKTATGWLLEHKPVLIAIAGAIALVVAPIPTLVAGIIYAWTHFETFRDIVKGVVDTVRTIVAGFVDGVLFIWRNFGDAIVGYVTAVWETVSGVFRGAFDAVVGIFDFFRDLFTGKWGKLWGDVKDVVFGVWEGIKAVVQGAIDSTIAILDAAWTAIKLAAGAAWDLLKLAAGAAWDLIKAAITAPIDAAKAALGTLWDGIKAAAGVVWDGIKTAAAAAWDGIKAAVLLPITLAKIEFDLIWAGIKLAAGLVWSGIQTAAAAAWDGIKAAIMAPINAVKNGLDFVWQLISGAAAIVWDTIKTAASTAWDGIKTAVMTPIETARDLISGIWDTMVTTVTGLPSRIASAASGMWDGIKNAFKAVLNTIIGWWNNFSFPSFKIPSVDIPGLGTIGGGTLGGWHLPQIPTLASGAVLRETTPFIGGEYPGASSNPEIVTPQSIMAATFEEVIRGMNWTGGRGETMAPVINNNGRDVTRADLVHVLNVVRLAG